MSSSLPPQLSVLLPLAQAGDPRGILRLALCFLNGEGVRSDPERAARWFRRGALRGNVRSMYYLGTLYHRGKGVPESKEEALFWFQRAALQGDADAQRQLDAVCGKEE